MNKTLMPLFLWFVCLFATSSLAEPLSDAPKVYGEPGEGRICVTTRGGTDRWGHPGIYWLPKGTTLLEFAKRAEPKPQEGGEDDVTLVLISHKSGGGKHFRLGNIRPNTPAASFVLEDGDFLRVDPAIT